MRYTMERLSLPLAALILLAAPGTTVPAPPHTGIQGNAFIFRGPIWIGPPPIFAPPVVRIFPVATSFSVLSAVSGREVTHVVTDTNGAFRVLLPPGRYVLVPDPLPPPSGCGDATPIEVTVQAREFTGVTITYLCSWQIIIGIPTPVRP
jgi:hypothetical protein